MRPCAQPLLRRFGFRRRLVWNGVLSTCCSASYAAVPPDPGRLPAIYALLLVGGFFQSLQFIAYNTIAYADIPRARMSAATSFYSTFQQLSLSLGITISAAVLAGLVRLARHARPSLDDFSIAFMAIAAIGLLASPAGLGLHPDAGEELSGHHEPAEAD